MSVVDAVFRSPNRHYTGTSSSPEATKPNSRTQRNQPLAVPAAPAAPPTAAERVTPGTSHRPGGQREHEHEQRARRQRAHEHQSRAAGQLTQQHESSAGG